MCVCVCERTTLLGTCTKVCTLKAGAQRSCVMGDQDASRLLMLCPGRMSEVCHDSETLLGCVKTVLLIDWPKQACVCHWNSHVDQSYHRKLASYHRWKRSAAALRLTQRVFIEVFPNAEGLLSSVESHLSLSQVKIPTRISAFATCCELCTSLFTIQSFL